ncbi:MAG: dephospho-CoA kinase [Pseudomonadota bacterium]|nr:dephospho-CoA kinase [Pseudomonadota bacterium]
MRVVGLTGGIASGKSTAAKLLGELGAQVIDADVLGHEAYNPGTSAFRAVVQAFGEDIVAEDGSINRRALGGKVFGNDVALKRLTDIVWPEIRRLAELEIHKIRGENPTAVIVLEAAVLFEAGWEDIADEIWVVVVEPEIAIERAMQRDGADRSAIEARINSQLSNEERTAKAHLIIDNSEDEEALVSRVKAAWKHVANG